MKLYYVYILECADSSFYVGVTNDLYRRLEEHKTGVDPGCYTFSKRPVKLKHHTIFIEPTAAIAYEKKLKGWSRAKKQALINRELSKLPGLSASKTPRGEGTKGPSTGSG